MVLDPLLPTVDPRLLDSLGISFCRWRLQVVEQPADLLANMSCPFKMLSEYLVRDVPTVQGVLQMILTFDEGRSRDLHEASEVGRIETTEAFRNVARHRRCRFTQLIAETQVSCERTAPD